MSTKQYDIRITRKTSLNNKSNSSFSQSGYFPHHVNVGEE